MELVALILYGLVNVAMVVSGLVRKGDFYQFPFWMGVIALGWFFPQAIGGYSNLELFPKTAYANGMLFATLCTLAMWVAYSLTSRRQPCGPSWLDTELHERGLYLAGAALVIFGFFFQWKVWNMPEEVLAGSQWSGVIVKYLFLSSVFKFGFIALWLLYLSRRKLFDAKYIIFIAPCLFSLVFAALGFGRRADMMNLVSYLAVSAWFVRRIAVPRWMIVAVILMGLTLINGIETYRNIMLNSDASFKEKISSVFNANYASTSEKVIKESGLEFTNYIIYRRTIADLGEFDFGAVHWNELVFNYVPAQIVTREVKESLMIPLTANWMDLAEESYGHSYAPGTTMTGYNDAFGSFGWFGFIKFLLIGTIMGTLYRHAMAGGFFAQLLYVYALGTGMHSVSHGTNQILLSVWVYFFLLGFPALYWARVKSATA